MGLDALGSNIFSEFHLHNFNLIVILKKKSFSHTNKRRINFSGKSKQKLLRNKILNFIIRFCSNDCANKSFLFLSQINNIFILFLIFFIVCVLSLMPIFKVKSYEKIQRCCFKNSIFKFAIFRHLLKFLFIFFYVSREKERDK